MNQYTNPLEILWDNLLSRQPDLVRDAYLSLSPEEQGTVIAHLQRMVQEPGWQTEQQVSAQAALLALGIAPAKGKKPGKRRKQSPPRT